MQGKNFFSLNGGNIAVIVKNGKKEAKDSVSRCCTGTLTLLVYTEVQHARAIIRRELSKRLMTQLTTFLFQMLARNNILSLLNNRIKMWVEWGKKIHKSKSSKWNFFHHTSPISSRIFAEKIKSDTFWLDGVKLIIQKMPFPSESMRKATQEAL